MKHLWIVLAACLFVLGGPETLARAKPAASSAAQATSPSKQAKSSKAQSKRTASRGDEEGVDGPPPPPASNEIPPPPPPLKLKRKKRRQKRSRRSRRYRYKRGGAGWKSKRERYEDMRRWEERYGDREYRRRKRRRRRVRRKRRSRTWYRRYRRKRYLRKRNRARFWWSSESGLYLFSYSPSAGSSSTYDYLGLIAGGRIGVTYKSFVMSFGAAMAFSLSDDGGNDDFANVGGFMGRLSASMGWLLGRYILMEGGFSMEYLGLNRGSLETSALLFPVHVGMTIRFPMGRRRRSAVGLQALLSFAHDPNTEGSYFSTTINLVFQTF